MAHPFSRLTPEEQRRLFIWFLIGSIGLSLVMNSAGALLKTPAATGGIVTFEFAWTVDGAQRILASWDEQARIRAGFVQGLDYLFLAVYAQAFALACLIAGRRLQKSGWFGAGLGHMMAWGMWFAALLDAVENFALVVLLFGSLIEPWPLLAGICAAVKFALLAAGLVYAIWGWAAGILKPTAV